MRPNKKAARAAGLLYVLVGITGAFGIAIVPGTLIVPGDATATAARVLGSESLFRLAIASELINAVAFIFLVLALRHLFRTIHEQLASLMVTFVLVSVPISCVNVLNGLAALALLSDPAVVSAFDQHQVDALASVFLRLHSQGFAIAAVFWGLWLVPLGLLVIRSGFAPRALGFVVILAGVAYVVASFASLLLLPYRDLVSGAAVIFEGVGEVSMILWLLIAGAKAQPAST